MDKFEQLSDFFRFGFFEFSFQNKKKDTRDRFIKMADSVRINFLQFHIFTTPYIEEQRKKIREKFEETYHDFFRQFKEKKQFYIITFGYSKIIRDLIKYTIPRMIGTHQGTDDFRELVNVIVFLPEHETKVDSRFIKHELTEGRLKRSLPVLVNHPDFILPLLNEDSRILILMGAEAFDREGRVVRTNEYKSHLLNFLGRANKLVAGKSGPVEEFKRIYTVVCAESFKRNEDLSRIHKYLDDQYDKVEMYERELISDIITDKEDCVLPA